MPETLHEYATLHGKKDFIGVIKHLVIERLSELFRWD